jgi:excisionase family DNA binding protein
VKKASKRTSGKDSNEDSDDSSCENISEDDSDNKKSKSKKGKFTLPLFISASSPPPLSPFFSLFMILAIAEHQDNCCLFIGDSSAPSLTKNTLPTPLFLKPQSTDWGDFLSLCFFAFQLISLAGGTPKQSLTKDIPPTSSTLSTSILTLIEAAKYLSIEESELLDLLERKEFPGKKIGTNWRISKGAIDNYLNSS